MNWRWDQGRLTYFQLDEIRRFANALSYVSGKPLPIGNQLDELRQVLAVHSDMPFLPVHYKVWRNYKRVFGCQMLATDNNGVLVCTDLCEKIAASGLIGDDYLLHFAKNFSYPSPVFDDYTIEGPQVFPVCALVKYLVSRFVNRASPSASLDELIDFVMGNGCDGTEPLDAYSRLESTAHRLPHNDDSYRQFRELVIFISQFTFLKWRNPNLILDVSAPKEARDVASLLEPARRPRMFDASRELLEIGRLTDDRLPEATHGNAALNSFDVEFTEGSRARSIHLRIERSRQLKEMYFSCASQPSLCDMCNRDMLDHYPWAERLVEIHHLLPLSSPLRVERLSTSLRDVVGLCPSCHRATHKFYSEWLRDKELDDFPSHSDAKSAYMQAKQMYVC